MWSPNGGEDGFPDPHTPGWISLWSPKGEDDSFSNHCQENQGLSLFLAIGKFGRSQAVGTEQCGTELGARGDGGEPEGSRSAAEAPIDGSE